MDMFDFTAEEANLIAIYAQGTRQATIAAIADSLPRMDMEFTALAERSTTKLATMTDGEFERIAFISDDEGE